MKTRFDKLLLGAVIICALALPAGFAAGEADAPTETAAPATPVPVTEAPATEVPATEMPAATAEPEQTPDAEASEAPADTPAAEAGATPSPEATPGESSVPSAEPSAEPTLEPSPEASSEPSSEPSLEPSPEPTLEPSPSAEPTPSPTPLPLPGSVDSLVRITPEGQAQEEDGVWKFTLSAPDGSLAFGWEFEGEAQSYLIYTEDAQQALSFIAETAERRIELPAASYRSGQYTLYVGAVLADGSSSWGSAAFAIAAQSGGNFPGGGFGGGNRGGSGASSAAAQEEQGFHITPGRALTSKHASGTMDDTAYTCSEITSSADALTALVLDSTQAEITLDNGNSGFFSELDGEKLTLTPESGGKSWRLSALAMRSLADSNVSRVVFQLGSSIYSLPTEMEFSGSVYASLRAQGYVAKDMDILIDEHGVRLCFAGDYYRISENGELLPFEG